MYLEEKVEQLENLSVDQGKQIEIIAKGLATITTDMQRGFAEAKQQQTKMNKELTLVKHQVTGVTTDLAEFRKEVNQKFDRIETKFDKIDEKFDKIDEKFVKIDERFDKMEQRFDNLDQRFDDLVTLIKSK